MTWYKEGQELDYAKPIFAHLPGDDIMILLPCAAITHYVWFNTDQGTWEPTVSFDTAGEAVTWAEKHEYDVYNAEIKIKR